MDKHNIANMTIDEILNDYIIGLYKGIKIDNKLNSFNSKLLGRTNDLIYQYYYFIIYENVVLKVVKEFNAKVSEMIKLERNRCNHHKLFSYLIKLRKSLKNNGLHNNDIINAIVIKLDDIEKRLNSEINRFNSNMQALNINKVINIFELNTGVRLSQYTMEVIDNSSINVFNTREDYSDSLDIIGSIYEKVMYIIKSNNINIAELLNTSEYYTSCEQSNKSRLDSRNAKISEHMTEITASLYDRHKYTEHMGLIRKLENSNYNIAYIVCVFSGSKYGFIRRYNMCSTNINDAIIYNTYEEAKQALQTYIDVSSENKYRYSEILEIDINTLREVHRI